MRCVLQKVARSRVAVDDESVGEIADGLMLLLGVGAEDTEEDADWLAEKILKLRLFSDPGSESFMEKSVVDHHGAILVVSQFTLFGNCKKGTRPSFTGSARPEQATELYEYFVTKLRESDLRVDTGAFGEHMEIHMTCDGPVTLWLDSKQKDY
ncbi:MAG: D-tyrosyl-tRNA(Tyr) deacylase [Candidatus Magasanikbacteria bacterium]|jgi:D-aminoacyl-tRNA deacylase|nr:D-tyrosyl-tRNA(Tyr) deacylase [Candidatus Magasanikbacteria bacterium]